MLHRCQRCRGTCAAVVLLVSDRNWAPPWSATHLAGLMCHHPLGDRCRSHIYRGPSWPSSAAVTLWVSVCVSCYDLSHTGSKVFCAIRAFQQREKSKGSVHPNVIKSSHRADSFAFIFSVMKANDGTRWKDMLRGKLQKWSKWVATKKNPTLPVM